MDSAIDKNITDLKDLVFSYYANKIEKRDVHFLFVIHLTRTMEVYIEDWLKNFQSVGIISIPYSEIPEVKEKLGKQTKIYSPKDVSEIPDLIFEICNSHPYKSICLVEIGGYSALMEKDPGNIVGSVEDTNQGYWNFKKYESRLKFPVISIAQTNLKNIENRFVGTSISYSLEKFVRRHFNKDLIAMKNILVMGYGEIGRGTAQKLKSTLANVYVYDSDPINVMLARIDGFNIADKIFAIAQADIIIGATGQRSLQISDVDYLKNNALLASASSKQVEFPMDELKQCMTYESKYLNSYKNKNGTFHVAYNGFPINFIDDSAFGEVFDIVMSSLLLAVDNLLESKPLPRVYDLELRLQQEVVRKYFELYEVDDYEKFLFVEEAKKERHDASSAIVVSKKYRDELMVLLLKHEKIGKWIPVGGHVERFESPESAVIRELGEEIGVTPFYWFDKNSKIWSSLPILFEEKMEEIPAPEGGTTHFHRDFIFVAIIDYCLEENFVGESKERIKWFTLDEIFKLNPDETTPETLDLIREIEKFKKELLR